MNEVVTYVTKQKGLELHDEKVLRQKIMLILQTLSLELLSVPVFRDQFEAFKEGPVIRTVFNVDRNQGKLSEKPRSISEGTIGFYTTVLDSLLSVIREGHDAKEIDLDPAYLTEISHTEAWTKRYTDQKGASKSGHSNVYADAIMTDEELFEFADVLQTKHKAFVARAESALSRV